MNPFDDIEDTKPSGSSTRGVGRPRKTVEKPALTPLDEGYRDPELVNEPLEFNSDLPEPDLAEIRKLREAAELKERNGHNLTTAPVLSTNEYKTSTITSPKVDEELILDLIRAEEIEADLVRKAGRYIESVDNVKPGVPYTDRKDERITHLGESEFAVPLINRLNINADGLTIRGGDIFDPGEGAQKPEPNPFATNTSSNPNDPRSESFLTCSNKMCAYREGCLRYRLRNRRAQSFPFFPESCRKDGIYVSVNDSEYQGYDPFDQLERGATGVTSLPSP